MQQLEAYLETLRPNSRRPYRQAFHEFQNFLKNRELWLNQYGLEQYIIALKRRKLSGNTIRLRFEALKSIYKNFLEKGIVRSDPFRSIVIRLPRRNWNRKRHYRLIPFEKVMAICDRPPNHTKAGIRDRALLACLFGGGLRKSEALSMTLADIKTTESGEMFLYLRDTKAQEDARQALPQWAVSRLVRQRDVRRLDGAKLADNLFCSYVGKKEQPKPGTLPTRVWDRLFKKWCNECGVRDASSHCARVTAISKLFSDRIDPKLISKFARHASILTTERYDARFTGIEQSAGKNLEY